MISIFQVTQLSAEGVERTKTSLETVKKGLPEHDYQLSITWSMALDEDVASIITSTVGYRKQADGVEGNELPMGDCLEVRLTFADRGVAPLQENKMNYRSTSLRLRRGVAGTSDP